MYNVCFNFQQGGGLLGACPRNLKCSWLHIRLKLPPYPESNDAQSLRSEGRGTENGGSPASDTGRFPSFEEFSNRMRYTLIDQTEQRNTQSVPKIRIDHASTDQEAGWHNIQDEASPQAAAPSIAIDHILQLNPNYGPHTRAEVRSRSVPLRQLREDRQPTPPVLDLPVGNDTAQQLHDQSGVIVLQTRLREQIFDAGKYEVFYTLTRSHDKLLPKTSILNIATLQHMALQQLQYDISCYVSYMYRTSQFYMELQGFLPLTELINKYCDAVRNLDLMKQSAAQGYETDAFLMKSSRALERKVMETVGLIPQHVLPNGPLPIPRDQSCPQLRDMGRNEAIRAAHEKKRVLRFMGWLRWITSNRTNADHGGDTNKAGKSCNDLCGYCALRGSGLMIH